MENLMENLLQGLRAAGESTRIRILALCQESSLTVSDLTSILRQSQPNLSRHLKLLVTAGLLERSREGGFAYFTLARRGEGSELAAALCRLCPQDDEIFQRDRQQLQQIKAQRADRAAAYFRDHADKWEEIRGIYSNNSAIEQIILDTIRAQLLATPLQNKNPQKFSGKLDCQY